MFDLIELKPYKIKAIFKYLEDENLNDIVDKLRIKDASSELVREDQIVIALIEKIFKVYNLEGHLNSYLLLLTIFTLPSGFFERDFLYFDEQKWRGIFMEIAEVE